MRDEREREKERKREREKERKREREKEREKERKREREKERKREREKERKREREKERKREREKEREKRKILIPLPPLVANTIWNDIDELNIVVTVICSLLTALTFLTYFNAALALYRKKHPRPPSNKNPS